MPWLHFHELRVGCASVLLAYGFDLYTIAKVLGHSTIRMTERYAHLQAQREAMEKAFSQIMNGGS
ncbi:tyrosine-type recombinase/integrase [Acidithiobacillus ferrooxidans]|uniref:tyrosine-type recombinase/integrase n=1 Tax=Acidithiobacillus ferrooxidans TaxID=920 RepID=UPI000ABC3577|nr:tyrosine-type recombinase/integrase [Acidithiobacillus ferrooxidans]MCR2829209.1 tyrosine-type recombinase/integrase [Acidithiobacillus ferrooxidans]